MEKTTMKKTTTKVASKKDTRTPEQIAKARANGWKPAKGNEIMNKPEKPLLTPKQEQAQLLKHLNDNRNIINKEVASIEQSFIKIGFALYNIREDKLFKATEFKNVYELASAEFGIARGTCHSYIDIIDRFAKRDADGKALCELDERYQTFKSSQLIAIASIKDDEVVEQVNPDMSVRDIKALKNGKSEPTAKQEVIDVDYTEVKSTLVCEIKTYEEIADSEAVIRKLLEKGRRVQIVEVWEEYKQAEGGDGE